MFERWNAAAAAAADADWLGLPFDVPVPFDIGDDDRTFGSINGEWRCNEDDDVEWQLVDDDDAAAAAAANNKFDLLFTIRS